MRCAVGRLPVGARAVVVGVGPDPGRVPVCLRHGRRFGTMRSIASAGGPSRLRRGSEKRDGHRKRIYRWLLERIGGFVTGVTPLFRRNDAGAARTGDDARVEILAGRRIACPIDYIHLQYNYLEPKLK